jgi:hypothetical protein
VLFATLGCCLGFVDGQPNLWLQFSGSSDRIATWLRDLVVHLIPLGDANALPAPFADLLIPGRKGLLTLRAFTRRTLFQHHSNHLLGVVP